MALTAYAASWFLPFALPICIWVAWNDMKFMKIPNKAVIALTVVFLVVGALVLPWSTYPWQLVHLVVVLVAGFLLNMIGALGAGDAKFAAAMAPFIAFADIGWFCMMFALVLVVSFLGHRIVRQIPAITARTPDWVSWESRKFPMGLSLGIGLVLYLTLGVIGGAA